MPLAKILVVEDEAPTAREIHRSLEKLGYSVAAITDNGLDAINLAKQLKPDLIIMDIMLRGPVDGIDAAVKISSFSKIPFVYLTAHQSDEILERSKATSPYGYLLKPLNERDLNSCIRMALYRFEAEQKLKESEERYSRLADNARDMIFRMSVVNGIYEYVNQACVDLTGYSHEEFYNNPMFIKSILHPKWVNYFNHEWHKLQNGEAEPVYEYQIITKQGDERWLNQRNVLIYNDEHIPIAIEGIVTDITEQKNAETQLRQQREEYKMLFDAIPAIVFVKDKENKIIRANKIASEYLGVRLSELEGRYIEEFFPDQDKAYDTEDKDVLSGEPVLGVTALYHHNGRDSWIQYDKYPYRNDKGEITGVIMMAQDITKKKITERALEESEKKYRNLANNAPVAFTRLMIKANRYEFINNEFEKQSGYTLEEFNSLSEEEYRKLIHPDDLVKVRGEFGGWVKEGCSGIKKLAYRIINKFGDIIWLDSYHYADYDESGAPVAINQLYFNINERIEYENILSESKQYLDAFFSQSLDGIFIAKMPNPVIWDNIIDKDKSLDEILENITITRVNKPLCEQFGMSEEEVLKIRPSDYYGDNMDKAKKRWRKFLDSGKSHSMEFFSKPSNEVIFIEGDYYCLYDSEKRFIGYIGIQRDMTKRKVAEDAMKLSEEKFRAVAESIPAQVVIFQDEKFVYVNPYSYNITGYTVEELLKMNFWDLVHSDFTETAKQRGISRQKGEDVPDNYEMKIITKSGDVKWINYSARVIDYNGKPAVVGVATNISEIKKAEDALKHSLREKEILLKEIHHRVKNNLQIVSSLLKIQSSYVDDEKVKQLFKESQNRVRSMSLIHQKLYQTKDLAHIDFREYIDTVSTHLQHSFGILEDKVKIIVDVHNISMTIDNAIPAGLIINELITNALKHAFKDGANGEIYINLAYDEFSHEYWLVVRDNGSGIRNDFDINKSGSFGLKLVSTLVGQMGGAIEIISQGGTEFRIMFKNVEYKERN
jgi:PAS domain S-box-containing protein